MNRASSANQLFVGRNKYHRSINVRTGIVGYLYTHLEMQNKYLIIQISFTRNLFLNIFHFFEIK